MGKICANAKPTLPKGWTIVQTVRRAGKTRGIVDKTYLSPTFQAFRSLIGVQRYLDHQKKNQAPPVLTLPSPAAGAGTAPGAGNVKTGGA